MPTLVLRCQNSRNATEIEPWEPGFSSRLQTGAYVCGQCPNTALSPHLPPWACSCMVTTHTMLQRQNPPVASHQKELPTSYL
jgi:hypothetical protein